MIIDNPQALSNRIAWLKAKGRELKGENMTDGWSAVAFNQVPDSPNQIHGDDLARQYGFTGGLVPGVTISAYLIHPAVERWGMDWLQRGAAHVQVKSPMYDGETFDVAVTEQSSTSYSAKLLRSEEVTSAMAEVSLADQTGEAPQRRRDAIADTEFVGPAASFERWAQLKQDGCQAFRYRWSDDQPMGPYLRDTAQMPRLLQPDGGGFASMSFILSCGNWILASNVYMNPWVHLETRSQNYAEIPPGTEVVTEMRVVDYYEKKGHEFIDVSVALFDEQDDRCLTTIEQRAIYKLRGT